ncbi:alpha/beta hydrolase-fold protein [Cohnella faecalis]|uniref:Esterase family protein n=1 Tax=Cohnella faecalis TaxID=2315694 RepID=A0A398CDM5_9BACL|nr:alpha/beta hydrolase-fold protein [Cohnella faecalis]RIE01286.1 esterase family protein [Cohnella faecalis]
MHSKIIAVEKFHSTILDNDRTIYIYLPSGYEQFADVRYPVLYMQDGQHTFHADERGGSWDLHLAADRLIEEKKIRPIIIVAVSHITDARISEYMHPLPGGEEVFGTKCHGEEYEQFLIQEVKPYIDEQFRTLKGPADTAVMGSSAGGLVSYNLGFRRPDIFGKVGALCPYFVRVEPTGEERWLSKRYKERPPIDIWIDVGEAEGYTVMEKHVRSAVDDMLEAGFEPGRNLWYYYVPGSGHTQKDWADRVHAPLLMFFGEIGQPVKAELAGPDRIGLSGLSARLNPIVTYDSGFVATDLNASYEIGDPSVLGVSPDGKLAPLREGTTTLTYRNGELASTLTVRVVPDLSATVNVSVHVEVPDDTPDVDILYAGIEIPKIGSNLYGGTFPVPRNMAFFFRISRGMGKDEADRDGNEVPMRFFKAKEGLALYYRVENWIDAKGDRQP